MGTQLAFLLGKGEATHILPALGTIVAAIGSTQTAAGSRGGAILIIASLFEGFLGEILSSGILCDEGIDSFFLLVCVQAKARISGIAVELYSQFQEEQTCRVEAMASLL